MDMIQEESWSTRMVFVLLFLVLAVTAIWENGYENRMLYWSILVLAVVLLPVFASQKPKKKMPRPLAAVFAFFGGWWFLSLFFSVDFFLSFRETMVQLAYFLIFYAAWLFLTDQKIQTRFLKLFFLFAASFALVGILFYLFEQSGRITSLFMNPNPLGCYLAMASFLGLGLFLEERRFFYRALPALVVVQTAFFLTGSRGALLAYFLILSFFIFANWSGRKFLRVCLLLILAVLFLEGVSFTAAQLQQEEHRSLEQTIIRQDSFTGSSLEGRLAFFAVAFRAAQERPLWGSGAGTFHLIYNDFRGADHWWSKYPHNHYLQLAAEGGWPLLASFVVICLLFVFYFFRSYWGKEDFLFYSGILAAWLVFLIHIGLDFTWNMPAVTMLFAMLSGFLLPSEKSFFPEQHRSKGLLAVLLLVILFNGVYLGGLYLADVGHQEEKPPLVRYQAFQKAGRLDFFNHQYQWSQGEMAALIWRETKDDTWQVKAVEHYEKALAGSPQNYYYASSLAKILWDSDAAETEAVLQRTVKLGGFSLKATEALGYYYLEKESFEKARAVFQQGLAQKDFYFQHKGENEETRGHLRLHYLGLAKSYEGEGYWQEKKLILYLALQEFPADLIAQREIMKNKQES